MGISAALQWWEEWQLRVLVLASLFVHYILCFSYIVRCLPKLRRLRVVIWIAYIGSDALAIYALATLFNRHKKTTTTTTTTTALEVMWVPIFLIHLGGPQAISAYSLEDNELWKRHVITFVSQVTVALYVFCKWWSGEKRLLLTAVLLFVVGVLKFGLKPWALKTASFNSMLDSIPVAQHRRRGEEKQDFELEEYVRKAKECVKNARPTAHQELSFKELARKAKEYVKAGRAMADKDPVAVLFGEMDVAGHTKKMFIDMSPPYCMRFIELESFMKVDKDQAHKRVQRCLGRTFELLYSRMGSALTPLGKWLLLIPIPSITIASVVLLAKSNMDGYNKNDVRVTYIIYWGHAIMEVLPFFLAFMYLPFKCCRPLLSRGWHDMVSQCNLMSFCARKRKPTLLMKLATFSSLREYLNMHWYTEQQRVADQITGLVYQHLIDGWKVHIHNADGYKRFNDIRRFGTQLKGLGWNSIVPFDHNVLLWHIATDLCFHYPGKFPQGEEEDKRGSSSSSSRHISMRRSSSRKISNYMVYLLSARPEMLMPGTSPGLFTIAGNKVQELVLKHSGDAPLDTEEGLAQEIIRVVKSCTGDYQSCTTGDGDTTTYRVIRVIRDACMLAEALMELGDEERWTMIQRMWVEMLCYSAVRCRGYLHAKSLGDGGECLTSVWLLWSFMGMETLADMLQRPQPPENFSTV